MIRNVLSIAGSDPSGGAGIQADIKAISANGAYAMTAITALTAQNTQGVSWIELVPPDFVAAQIAAVFADVRVDAVKIGMIATSDIAATVADALTKHADNVPVVLDPVMIAKGGAPLLADDAVKTLRDRLLPLATLVTPNLPEAAHLLDEPVTMTRDAMAHHAQALAELGPQAVLIKGGHLPGDDSPDVLYAAGETHWFESKRTATQNTHGTGCSLSSALAAELAKGAALPQAVGAAKAYITAAIVAADDLNVGQGHGPIHHFTNLWNHAHD
ncbi:bifunctional hydroxymethylpyrimidine kinase/phosphomethylpyrimidine kinase [Cognatiyoonia sp. IB215182]|uniref:bifunctional hydroxymethylpyrimidine kinase/phosphomethylpyrimidine kinase n=1 Tax=Cognatiyoonia sp. IB215182 TaxID=3097353 RepID=UPI002A0E8064|nr:bifunctional hydroxymethylpyrimidine kinase/phosphomethylpyrimidine kinase [Cognatiyoonia sp. IB215182]MDX8351819.1 bifunctional hydroxymethylpyrimidine kinase/phosphomethylpyrimidine kinase [Cognatiyoonia sp. IB215182]